MKRVFLFLATNIAILLVLSIVLHITGANRFFNNQHGGLDYSTLMLYSVIIGFTGSFISLWISKWMAKMSYNIQVIQTPADADQEWLVGTIRHLAAKARVQMPEVGIYESPEANAFATGPSRSNSLVAVSSGLLRAMEKNEIEGVLAHEMTHVSNGDMVTMTLLQGVLNTFVIFLSRIAASLIDQMLRKNDDDSGPGFGFFIASMIFQLILGFLASLIVMAFSRHREFRADAGAAQLTGKASMIGALRRLQQIMESDPIIDDRSTALSAFKINGKPHETNIMASHPSLEARIEALEKL